MELKKFIRLDKHLINLDKISGIIFRQEENKVFISMDMDELCFSFSSKESYTRFESYISLFSNNFEDVAEIDMFEMKDDNKFDRDKFDRYDNSNRDE